MPDHDPLSDYEVTLHYKKGSDTLIFRSKDKAKKAIAKLKKDITDLGWGGGFVSVTDDDDNTADFQSKDFVRAVTTAPTS